MKELPAHVEDRLYEFFMKTSVPRLLEKEARERGEKQNAGNKSA